MKKDSLDKNLGLSIVETIESTELPAITQDVLEAVLDSSLDEGVLRDIPVVGTIVALAKTAVAIRDRFLIKKILRFLREIQDVTEEERSKFIKDMDSQPGYKQEVGEKLIMLLDRLDEIAKSEIIGKLFKAYLRDDITIYEYNHFSSIVERGYLRDLEGLFKALIENYGYESYAENLYHLGLSELKFKEQYAVNNKVITQKDLNQILNPFGGTLIVFKPSEIAYVMAQIVSGASWAANGYDYVSEYKVSREWRMRT